MLLFKFYSLRYNIIKTLIYLIKTKASLKKMGTSLLALKDQPNILTQSTLHAFLPLRQGCKQSRSLDILPTANVLVYPQKLNLSINKINERRLSTFITYRHRFQRDLIFLFFIHLEKVVLWRKSFKWPFKGPCSLNKSLIEYIMPFYNQMIQRSTSYYF